MKPLLISILLILSLQTTVNAQRVPQVPDSVRKKFPVNYPTTAARKGLDYSKLNQDSLIKDQLLELALSNPELSVANANIRISELELKRAKSSWLSSFNAGANINEFVINNSPAANFFPKYNLGIGIPFNIIAKAKSEKKIAAQNVIINKEYKKEKIQSMRTLVFSLYEEYKEKKELLRLQKISMDDDYQAYLAAQKNYADGNIELDEMNRIYKTYVSQQSLLVTREKELNIATIQIESLINMPLEIALQLKKY